MENKETLQELIDNIKNTKGFVNDVKDGDISSYMKAIESLPNIQKSLKRATSHLSKKEQEKLMPIMSEVSNLIKGFKS